jgi:2-C-methyl-D-erythritol 4-phosphate cytidylyltransferase
VGVWGLVLAAGNGTRFGGAKQFARVHGHRLVDRVVELVWTCCNGLVLVLPEGVAWDGPAVSTVVRGDRTRSGSVRAGLAALPEAAEIVVIHDPAHPLAPIGLFEAVIEAVRNGADAAAPAQPVDEPLKRSDASGRVLETVARHDTFLIQTPHAFRAPVLRAVHAEGPEASEDTELVERRGGSVVLVPGDPRNLHVTAPEHLAIVAELTRPS